MGCGSVAEHIIIDWKPKFESIYVIFVIWNYSVTTALWICETKVLIPKRDILRSYVRKKTNGANIIGHVYMLLVPRGVSYGFFKRMLC